MPAGKRAEQAVAANPEKSDRVIAEQISVDHKTVAKARARTGDNSPVDKRTGKDGKTRKMPELNKAKTRRQVVDHDEDIDITEVPATPAEKRAGFLIFSNEAKLAARQDPGLIDDDVLHAARATASAWDEVVKAMEQGKRITKPVADLSMTEQAGAFHTELMNVAEQYCQRVEAWCNFSETNAESRRCVVQALEIASMRLQRAAQDIDGR